MDGLMDDWIESWVEVELEAPFRVQVRFKKIFDVDSYRRTTFMSMLPSISTLILIKCGGHF